MARITRQQRRLYEMCAMAIVERRANLDGASHVGFDIDLPVFSVGRVGELADIHPQTLRQYDRQGLVVPGRTDGGARRYSLRDVDRLVQAQHLSQDEGINLSGVMRILELEEENRQLRHQVQELTGVAGFSVFTADMEGRITQTRRSHRARQWRGAAFGHDVRELTAGESHRAQSKSVMLWHQSD
ncbi:heat shock protein transcriptional repressor HspR [Bifidobacterium canis]|uniref:HspR n=1 Tax=Bifidobacterium canis TaxID=2610880 RepID=A0A7K1J6G9_9BIFI|nr:helix-turn-helix transcriptional regulator [Bifidobacterium canis]MUH60266.1 HspR [Bifidobacterium canis]